MSSTNNLKGFCYTVTYKDLRLGPKFDLLREIEKIELGWNELQTHEPQEIEAENDSLPPPDNLHNPELVQISHEPHSIVHVVNSPKLMNFTEWNQHLSSLAYLTNGAIVKAPDHPSKNIGNNASADPKPTDFTSLISARQFILQNLYKCLGNEPLSEQKLQCAPRWLLVKSIDKE